jgi:hypothetical protein
VRGRFSENHADSSKVRPDLGNSPGILPLELFHTVRSKDDEQKFAWGWTRERR